MSHGNLLNSFEWLSAIGDFVNGVKNVSTVIPGAARVARSDDHVFKDDESVLVLERLALDFFRTNSAGAVLATITVGRISF